MVASHCTYTPCEHTAFCVGHLAADDSRIDGLNATSGCPVNPADPSSGFMLVNYDAIDGGPIDPKHDFNSITQQVCSRRK